MNDNKLKKQANSKHNRNKLQDFTFYFEETPHTVFKSKWIKSLARNTHKLKLAR